MSSDTDIEMWISIFYDIPSSTSDQSKYISLQHLQSIILQKILNTPRWMLYTQIWKPDIPFVNQNHGFIT